MGSGPKIVENGLLRLGEIDGDGKKGRFRKRRDVGLTKNILRLN